MAMMLLLSTALLARGKDWTERSKEITKEYSVSAETMLSIDNSFGTVEIQSWSQNKVEVYIEIKVETRNDDRADELLDRIRVDISDSNPKRELRFKTDISSKNNNWNGRNERFEINYTVKMPINNPLRVENRHGETVLGDLNGELDIRNRHGDISTGDLGGEVEFDLSFGSLYAGKLNSGELTIRHMGSCRVASMGDMEIDMQHSNLDVGDVGEIDLSIRHGNVEFEQAVSIVGSAQHSEVEVESISEELSIGVQHGGIELNNLQKGFKRVDIDAQFSKIDLGISKESNFRFDAEASFGNIYVPSEVDLRYKDKEQNSIRYRGSYGGSDADAEIRLRNQHGNTSLRWR